MLERCRCATIIFVCGAASVCSVFSSKSAKKSSSYVLVRDMFSGEEERRGGSLMRLLLYDEWVAGLYDVFSARAARDIEDGPRGSRSVRLRGVVGSEEGAFFVIRRTFSVAGGHSSASTCSEARFTFGTSGCSSL